MNPNEDHFESAVPIFPSPSMNGILNFTGAVSGLGVEVESD